MQLLKVDIDTEVDNDSIGAYEFWGQKGYDHQPDYIRGYIIVETDGKSSEELSDWLKDNEDELWEFIRQENIPGDDPEYDPIEISCIARDDPDNPNEQVKKWHYFIEYTAGTEDDINDED